MRHPLKHRYQNVSSSHYGFYEHWPVLRMFLILEERFCLVNYCSFSGETVYYTEGWIPLFYIVHNTHSGAADQNNKESMRNTYQGHQTSLSTDFSIDSQNLLQFRPPISLFPAFIYAFYRIKSYYYWHAIGKRFLFFRLSADHNYLEFCAVNKSTYLRDRISSQVQFSRNSIKCLSKIPIA